MSSGSDRVKPDERKPLADVLVLDGAAEPDRVEAGVAGGHALAYTCRDPDKASENEDTVAIVPYGPAPPYWRSPTGPAGCRRESGRR